MPIDLELIRAKEGLSCLLTFDSVWTGYTTVPPVGAEDPLAMFQIALAFAEELENAEHYGDHIYKVASDERFSHPSHSLITVLSEDEDGQVALAALDEHDQSVASLARSGLVDIREARDGEMQQLEADARNLLMGHIGAGRLGDRFLCGLAKASMAAGLITIWVPPHLHVAPVVGLGATVYKSATCGEHLAPPPAAV
jgi:hypothetical protein